MKPRCHQGERGGSEIAKAWDREGVNDRGKARLCKFSQAGEKSSWII